jgi:hypothetical protein
MCGAHTIGRCLLRLTLVMGARNEGVYLLRTIWDTPPRPFTVIPHYAPPLLASGAEDIDQWCAMGARNEG